MTPEHIVIAALLCVIAGLIYALIRADRSIARHMKQRDFHRSNDAFWRMKAGDVVGKGDGQ